MKMKVMVTGATGLLGRAVVKQLRLHNDYHVIACGFSRVQADVYRLDLTEQDALDAFIETHRPTLIIHCAAERRPDVSELAPEAALALNVSASNGLALAAKRHGAWLLYISTDYVFDGKSPDYAEQDPPNPVNFYGESKWLGEQAVSGCSKEFAILRLPILYGAVERIEESAILVMLAQLQATTTVQQDDWAIRSPTSTLDIAHAVIKLINHQRQSNNVRGVYHFSASERMTKYEMVQTMARLLGLAADHIEPASHPIDTAKRPQNCSLSCCRLTSLGIISTIKFEQGLKYSLDESAAALQGIGLYYQQN
ncbi:SDR family oxidoreductase [Shewanella colwelliana]|uniref:dTDP-4-dehydrorhamnose reductase family protein n=1 Tax=Shewanella colwelliana TaxID=23 RepID=UPI00299F3E33|nr:SDR family oxidoreductase [Shewanella colwelliana]MDX1280051.1 SDR family oxidoreductase [Shewanella colwelliana]